MFDFERLDVYQEIKLLNKAVLPYIFQTKIDIYLADQWKRATISMALNLAEGTSRMSDQDKRHFYTIARSSAFECVAILDILAELNKIKASDHQSFYAGYEKISKMILGMIRSFSRK